MTNEQTAVLVLKDSAGEYFLVPQQTLERGRVPAGRKAELGQLVVGQQDVQGHQDNMRFELQAVLISAGGGAAPPSAGIGQVIMNMLEDRAGIGQVITKFLDDRTGIRPQ